MRDLYCLGGICSTESARCECGHAHTIDFPEADQFYGAVPTPEHYWPVLYVLGVRRPEDRVAFFNDEDPEAVFMTSFKLA